MFNFQQILNSSPEVKEYFGLYAKSNEECVRLALELIKEAIAKRKKKSGGNKFVKVNNNSIEVKKQQQPQTVAQPKTSHSNVTYIKHNRFLSPSQKKQITPKVTQIIPIPSQNHIIYGKPKVKLDQYEGCQVHHRENCLEESYENNNSSSRQQQSACENNIQENDNKHYDDGVQILQNQKQQQVMQIPYQYEEYLSPKNKAPGKNKNSHDWNKTVKGGQKGQRQNQSMSGLVSPKGSKQTNKSSKARMTSPKTQMFNNQCCPQQNYSNVQSKIKQLIMRDKKNREFEKQLQKQKQQIDEIEERQNKLLIAQKQREEKLRNQAILEMEREKQRQRERERQIEREMQKQREKEREMEMKKQREIEIQMQIERQRERQREMFRELQIQKQLQIRREMERERERQYIRQMQERQAAQAWRIRCQEEASNLNQHMMRQRNYDFEGDVTSSQSSSIVNLHDHQLQQSREQCYQCEIQRLRKQKQRAKKAIRQIEHQEAKRSQILMEISQNTQLQADYYRRYNNSMIY